MIRFRLGQRWKRERAAPVDAFALEVDGVDLLAGAAEEPLAQVVPELVDAAHRICASGERLAQLSLAEAHIEIALAREGREVEIAVVSLGRPARLLRNPLRVDEADLSGAAVKCARALLADLDAQAPQALRGARRRRMVQRLEQLEKGRQRAPQPERWLPWSYRQLAAAPGAFGFTWLDERSRLLAFGRSGEAPLASLLAGGQVELRLSEGGQAWAQDAVPFLFALELSRRAADVTHALELDEAEAALELGGGAAIRLDLRGGAAYLGDERLQVSPQALLEGAYQLGLSLAFAASTRSRAQSRNPYLQELSARCREGLAHLRAPSPAPPGARSPGARKKRGARDQPLLLPGRVKRLRFELRWEKQGVIAEQSAHLCAGKKGVVVSAPEEALGFTPQGELLFRRIAPRGVAVSADGLAVLADDSRVLCFQPSSADARWVRDHDGAPVGPELLERGERLVTTCEGRAAIAFSRDTGRELWRAVPPRTQSARLAIQGDRVLLATDSGYLYGLELGDGQIRYRVRAPLPFVAAPSPWGRKMVAALGRGEHHALFASDLHSGEIAWEQELSLSLPCAPLPSGPRVVIAGERDGDGVLLCFGATGKPLWERALHLGHGPFSLLQVGRSVLVSSPAGAATLIAADGRAEWHVGAAGEPVAVAIPAALSRGILLVPGEVVRAIEPRGGHVLAEVRAGAGLVDLRADARLNLYLLDETSALRAFRLGTQLSVVGGA